MEKEKRRPARTVFLVVLGTLAVVVGIAVLLPISRGPTPEEITADLESRIRPMQRISSVEYIYRHVVYASRERRRLLGIPTGSSEVLFSIDIRVTAGVDLTEGFDLSTEDDDRLFITLPAPQILLVDADETSIDEYFAHEVFLQTSWLDIGSELEKIKEDVRTDALERGILERAGSNVTSLMTGIVDLAGYDNVYIRFRPAEEIRG